MKIEIETENLILHQLTQADLPQLADLLERCGEPSDDAAVKKRLAKYVARYIFDGYGVWAVATRSDLTLVGLCGIMMVKLGGGFVHELQFSFDTERREHAVHAASACVDYAKTHIGAPSLYCFADDEWRQSVAQCVGMTPIYGGLCMTL